MTRKTVTWEPCLLSEDCLSFVCVSIFSSTLCQGSRICLLTLAEPRIVLCRLSLPNGHQLHVHEQCDLRFVHSTLWPIVRARLCTSVLLLCYSKCVYYSAACPASCNSTGWLHCLAHGFTLGFESRQCYVPAQPNSFMCVVGLCSVQNECNWLQVAVFAGHCVQLVQGFVRGQATLATCVCVFGPSDHQHLACWRIYVLMQNLQGLLYFA